MKTKKALILCLFVAVSLATARGSEIVFNTDSGGVWNYGGPGGTFSATAAGGSGGINIDGGPFIFIYGLQISVVTGVTISASPGLALFSSTGSSVIIADSNIGTIFSGSLTNVSLNFAANGANGPIFGATFISGTFNPAFLSAYGLPLTTSAMGKTTMNLLGDFNAGLSSVGTANGSVTDLSQVPEPASLLLLSSGLFATGTFLRSKLVH